MTFNGDPFRTLGLPPGASLEQVKRAYRQLAKRYHPDSAGEAALPRFLAIQAAYDMLTGSTRPNRPRAARPNATPGAGAGSSGARQGSAAGGTGSSGSAGPSGSPGASAFGGSTGSTGAAGSTGRPTGGRTSNADANRANATRDAYRARRARTGQTGGTRTDPGSGPTPGTAWAREAPPGHNGGPAAGAGAQAGSADGRPNGGRGGTAGSGPAAGRSSMHGGTSARDRRARRTATLGSTSYDDAPHDPEPEWGGATWYGGSSGTYWTINPKEYADPRKHGPEYLARGRRFRPAPGAPSTNGNGTNGNHPPVGDTDDGMYWTDTAGAPPDDAPAGQAGAPPNAAAAGAQDEPPGPTTFRPRTRATWSTGGPSSAAGAADRPPVYGPSASASARPAPGGLGTPSGTASARTRFDEDDDEDALARPFEAPIPQRVLLALIAWPPIGYAVGAAINGATGCDRFSASCSPEASVLGWLVQPAIIALLLLVPAIARPAAVASISVGIGAVIGATILSIAGGAKDPTHSAYTLLIAILIMAYAVGLIGALSGRIRLPHWLRRSD
jgi:hypothetical protein